MSKTAASVTAPAGAQRLPAGPVGLSGTTSCTLANTALALSVFLTIPAIVVAMGSMAPWAFEAAGARSALRRRGPDAGILSRGLE